MNEKLDKIYSSEEFCQFLEEKRKVGKNYLSITTCSEEGIPLFEIYGDNQYIFKLILRPGGPINDEQQNKIEKNIDRIYLAGMTSCIVNYKVSFITNSLNIQNGETKTIVNAKEFETWFSRISGNRILIPDTNALINRSLSSLAFILGKEYMQNLKIRIPRLCILELERIANQDSQNKETRNEQKRKVMSAYAELLILSKNKGQLLPELDEKTFQAFSHVVGDRFTDSWIRREIRSYIHSVNYGADPKTVRKVTLVTSDLINALSANAEGLDIIYFSKATTENILPRAHSLYQIVSFIILCSILFEEIKITINHDNITVMGIWEGKTPSEWITDSIRIVSLADQ